MLPASLRHRPAALLLDAGDTLLFLDCNAVSEALAQLGEQVAPARLAATVFDSKRAYQDMLVRGRGHEDGWSVLVRAMLTGAGLSAERSVELLPGLRRLHEDFYFWRKVPEELPRALARARGAGIRLGVISNSEGRLQSVLERVGLGPELEIVIDSHLEGVSKPDPEIFRRALARMQVEAGRAVYAGDIPEVDVLGARAVGMHGVLVDAFDHYAGSAAHAELPRVRSVAQLVDELLALPPAG
jgi:HAD superfamily hydrolase (TIGR01662 family)